MTIVQVRPAVSVGQVVHQFGYNTDVDANTGPDEDIIAAGGDQFFSETVIAAANIDIVSSSADDAPAGTGATAITIEGLDGDYREISETVELNGTTDINPTLDYLRIQRAYVAGVGTNGTNAGTITIDDGTSTMAQIIAGFGETSQAAYTTPANYSAGWLLAFDCMIAATANAYAEGILQYRCNCNSAWRTLYVFNVTADAQYVRQFTMPIYLAPRSDTRLRIFDASANNLAIAGSLEIYLEP